MPDIHVTKKLLWLHKQNQANATVAEGAPIGLLPIIVSRSAIDYALDAGMPDEWEGDVATFLDLYVRVAKGEGNTDLQVLRMNAQNDLGLPLHLLPRSVLITNELSCAAGSEVLCSAQQKLSLDCAPAQSYRKMLLKVRETYRSLPDSRADSRKELISGGSRKPLNVLFATDATGYSGAEASWATLICNLDRKYFSPVVVLPAIGELYHRVRAANIPVVIRRYPFNELTPYNIEWWNQLVVSQGAEIVDINNYAGMPLMISARNNSVPIVLHIRRYGANRDEAILQFASAIVTVSDDVRTDVLACSIDPEIVITVYNGIVGPPKFVTEQARSAAKLRLELPADCAVIAMVARIDPSKRQEVLIGALARIVRILPNTRCYFAGEVSPACHSYYRSLKAFAASIEVSKKIIWSGFHSQLDWLYTASDVLVCCNAQEPLSRSVLEAISYGVPVITPTTGGNVEAIAHEHNGLHYNAGDADGLAEVVTQLLCNLNRHQEMRLRAFDSSRRFSVDAHVRHISALFQRLARK